MGMGISADWEIKFPGWVGVYSIINREMLVEVEEDDSNVTFAFDDNAF